MTLSVAGQPFPPGFANMPLPNDPGRYINAIAIRASQYDVAVDLLHQFALPGAGPPQGAQQVVCRTVMSPVHAKAFAHALQQAVDEWENQFGVLPSTDALTPKQTGEGESSDD